jgi:LL-diaminopimelate aminotransferase
VRESLAVYEKRRNLLVAGLRGMGFKVPMPKGTFYLWFPIEGSSLKFADRMLERGVVVTPGVGFGPAGEGFVRMALTQPVNRIEEALVRMKKAL